MTAKSRTVLELALRAAKGVVTMLVFVTVGFSAAFLLRGRLYAWLGTPRTEYLDFLSTALLGMLILFFGALGASWLRGARVIAVSKELLLAIARIAKGDFAVRVNVPRKHSGPYHELVTAINNMAEQLSQVEEMRRTFVSDVSHEIQSPLTSIGGFARALREDSLPAGLKDRYLGIIEAESARLSRLGDNLLRLSSLDAGSPAFAPAPYRLDRQIRDAILAAEPLWSAKGLQMEASLPQAVVEADADLLGQVWQNLIANAIKFTPPGGAIAVEAEARGDWLTCSVADTGVGIAPDDLPHVFERFFKADKSRTSAAGGSGLGLSIARRIVELHGGDIAVDSTPGQGSVFRVRLPLRAANRPPA